MAQWVNRLRNNIFVGGPVTGEIVDDIRNMGMIFHIPAYFRLYFKYNDVIYST